MLHGLLHLGQLALSFAQHRLTQFYKILPVYQLYVCVLICLLSILTQTLPCNGFPL